MNTAATITHFDQSAKREKIKTVILLNNVTRYPEVKIQPTFFYRVRIAYLLTMILAWFDEKGKIAQTLLTIFLIGLD